MTEEERQGFMRGMEIVLGKGWPIRFANEMELREFAYYVLNEGTNEAVIRGLWRLRRGVASRCEDVLRGGIEGRVVASIIEPETP